MADAGQKRARSESRSRSPPRQRKRPGAASRFSAADREAARRRQREKEEEAERKAQQEAASRGVHDVVRQHYNMVPERGREWRVTDSKIKGLRSFNNWVKSSTIQKFIGDERHLKILDIGCGKGGDLQKWQSSRKVELYVGADPADVSITQARERYEQMRRRLRRGQFLFHAEFYTKDCFGEWLGDIPIIKEVGIDPNVGPGNAASQRWGGGGFDMVTMMFCMHYAFESEEKARGMLRNVAGALKKGGRFIGCIPNSDVLTAKVIEHHKALGHVVSDANAAGDEDDRPTFASDDEDDRPTFASDNEEEWDPEKSLDSPKPKDPAEEGTEDKAEDEKKDEDAKEEGEAEEEGFEWGNSIYRVKFPGKTPKDGIFRPPFGWKYFYFLEEAVEEVPEYVVPWEAFRALAEDYNLELQYRKPFREVWEEQKGDPILGPLSERMGVRDMATGRLLTTDEELDAADFYHTFCFYKV